MPMAMASEEASPATADTTEVVASSVEVIDTVWKACAYGDIDKLKSFIEHDPNCCSKTDDQVIDNQKIQFGTEYWMCNLRVTIHSSGLL